MVIFRSVKIAHRSRSIREIEQRVSTIIYAFLSHNYQYLGEQVRNRTTKLWFVKRI